MVQPSEEERALTYRIEQQARENNRIVLEAALAGDEEARRQLGIRWNPLLPDIGWSPNRKITRDVLGDELP